ncbi:aminotransferase class IV [Maridesulfovibrio sp.]|uniref:aminotransferase class IV n=1 Tax=Maridesulfovibrio sp. TaxID=2795000 RepID=UPI0039F135DA
MIYFRDGKFIEDAVSLDLAQPAFRTGFGFFETICWNGNKLCHLDLHLDRARMSLAQFGISEQVLDYETVINDVLSANDLENEFARVNIFFPVEEGRTVPLVCAVPFEYIPKRTWTLKPCPHVFLSPLMAHKSTNRMDYQNAWQDALADGFNDALLLDFDGNVLESSFASLMFRKGDSFYETQTAYKLPGTARTIAARNIEINELNINLAQIGCFDYVYALNSLGGMIPVTAVGSIEFEADFYFAEKVSAAVLELEFIS